MNHHGIPQPTKEVVTRHVFDPVKEWFTKLFKTEINKNIVKSKINNEEGSDIL